MITPSITIKDRLRVLLPNDPGSYHRSHEPVPAEMLGDTERAKIVVTNYHAFRRRERLRCRKPAARCCKGAARILTRADANPGDVNVRETWGRPTFPYGWNSGPSWVNVPCRRVAPIAV